MSGSGDLVVDCSVFLYIYAIVTPTTGQNIISRQTTQKKQHRKKCVHHAKTSTDFGYISLEMQNSTVKTHSVQRILPPTQETHMNVIHTYITDVMH